MAKEIFSIAAVFLDIDTNWIGWWGITIKISRRLILANAIESELISKR